jgi:hypothetical protein
MALKRSMGDETMFYQRGETMRTLRHLVLAVSVLALPIRAVAESGVVTYACGGMVDLDNIFESERSTRSEKQYRIKVSFDAGYVRRAPELASGCLSKKIEICTCELTPDQIACRSFGMNPGGQETVMDFTIERRMNRMHIKGRLSNPQSGQVIETRGTLACQIEPSSAQ